MIVTASFRRIVVLPVRPFGVRRRRVFSILLALWIAVVSILTPGRVLAQAQLALVSSAGVLTSVSSAGVVARGASLLTASPWGTLLAVGSLVAGLYFTSSAGDTVNVLPKSKAAALTADLATTAALPATAAYRYMLTAAPCTEASSYAAACSAYAGCGLPTSTTKSCGSATVSGTTCVQPVGIYPNGSCPHATWNLPMSKFCPSGYSDTGVECIKTASSGSVAGQLPQTEGYKYPDMIAGQPVLRDMPTSAAKPIVQDKSIAVAGNPNQTVQVSPMGDGGVQITRRTFNPDTQTTKIETIQIDSAGKVTANSDVDVAGNVIGASSSTMTIEFPTDYNRESTQQQAVEKLEEIKSGASAPDAPDYEVEAKSAEMKDDLQQKAEAIPGQVAGDKFLWFSWVWTPPIGNCVPWSNTVHGQSVTFDICPYVDKVRSAIGYLLAVLSGAAVYSQLFRRDES